MQDRIIDCGNGDCMKIHTNSPFKLRVTVDLMHGAANCVALNFDQVRRAIDCMQSWADDNEDAELCELNEEFIANDLLDGNTD